MMMMYSIFTGINAAPPTAHHQRVQFLAEPISVVAEGSSELTLSAASVPLLAHHPLVSGPEFQYIRAAVGHRLDAFSSGVLDGTFFVGQANKALTDLYRSHVTRDYTLEGEFGMATDFSHTGRLIERTTYEPSLPHYTNQAFMVDMNTQEAYELAAKGKLHPDWNSPPIMTGLRLLHFQPPHYTLEVQCLNETQRYLCRILHEVGLELRSTTVCKAVRRTSDGPFTVQHALTRQHWTAPDVTQAIHQSRKARKSKSTQPGENTGTARGRQEIEEEAAVTGDSHRLHLVLTSKAFVS
ncbi:mitochondrial mRNA pseudouridine synthase TRUB2-like [Oncorhynchus tshawytscha]|uniref:mitochondrial mRNA pseudouridine synthase TRUB2-like n=1 Tax=Oncorhynchus tshawytscha TaxID=74940 RepID=UPI001C3D9D20|nr:mitochondrial mRNA pseudouridine synthase TRUB2-like [Oncorhynchus tshawytscha]